MLDIEYILPKEEDFIEVSPIATNGLFLNANADLTL